MGQHSHESLNISPNEIDPSEVLSVLSYKQRNDIQRAVMMEMMGEMDGTDADDPHKVKRFIAWSERYGALFDRALLKYAKQEAIPLAELADIAKHPGEITAITENLHFLISQDASDPPTYH